jgi:hypothetical protein
MGKLAQPRLAVLVNGGTLPVHIQWRKAVVAVTLGFVLFSARAGQAQEDSLNFFKNYFITGDYQVGGVGLSGMGVDGIATGTIHFGDAHMNRVPAEAEILAAFLYWQVVSTESLGTDSGSAGATFNGYSLSSPEGLSLAKVLDEAGSAPCWSSGGGTGRSDGSKRTYTYRADVLRFLPIGDVKGLPNFGKHLVNDADLQAHGKAALTVELTDSGSGNGVPNALGASLVVIYRDPDPSAPLAAIVIYDGGYTMDNSTQVMLQTIEGFYEPADLPSVLGKMTHIVGSGQANKSERLLINGREYFNPFQGSQGPDWDNFTINNLDTPSGSSLTTSVDTEGVNSFDCLNWGAIVYRTEVQDSDGDGLLNIWETPQPEPLTDPNGQPLPNLAAMGASPTRPDIFIEIGYMWVDPDPETPGELVSYGDELKLEHSHRPTHETLKLVGERFSLNGINVHFDVGDDYPHGEADPYIIRDIDTLDLARGGESMNEMETVCDRGQDDPPWVCQFSEYPGTVGWKSGFRFFRDRPLTLTDDECELYEEDGDPTTTCERVFDRNRKDIFRYALFAHALGVPKDSCLVDDPESVDFGYPSLSCMEVEEDYHIPQTFTGVGDYLGGDFMVTLGAFDDFEGRPVGTPFWVAGTLMHELGHNLGRRHGGEPFEPNCKPNYLSVMNYLFQLRGLVDELGVPQIDYSGQGLGALNETVLSESAGLFSALPYRTAWYAPLPGSIGEVLGIPAAERHCDGSPLRVNDLGELEEPPTARFDGTSIALGPIDWNADGDTEDRDLRQDLNFDGDKAELNPSSNDWESLRLNQAGSRRNVGGWFFVPDPVTGGFQAFMGPISLDTGRGDLGRGDLGRGDLGRGDLGRGDLGRGDLGRGDLGRGDLGRGDLGRGDLGRGDLGRGDLGRGDLGRGDLGRGDLGVGTDEGVFEIDRATATALGNTPPYLLTATVIEATHRILLEWKAPNVGSVTQFRVFRMDGDAITAASEPVELGAVSFVKGQVDYAYIDTTELAAGDYTYFVVADFEDDATSGPSNLAVVTAVNDAPVAVDDSYSTDEGVTLDVAAPGVLENDSDVDSETLTAVLDAGPSHGTLTLNTDGSFTYTPNPGFAGADSFTYTANDVGSSTLATVSITVVPILYDFEPVKNLPPPPKKKHSAGSAIPLEWRLTRNGVAVGSSGVDPKIRIIAGTGEVEEFTPEDPGSSSFQPPTESNGWTWHFNWQTVGPNGSELATSLYRFEIELRRNGQVFVVEGQVTFQ